MCKGFSQLSIVLKSVPSSTASVCKIITTQRQQKIKEKKKQKISTHKLNIDQGNWNVLQFVNVHRFTVESYCFSHFTESR